MELIDAIITRQSVRSFTDEKTDKDLIENMIEYANCAPSAGNLQARDFLIIDSDKIKEKMSEAAFHQNSIIEAPLVIVVCANLNRISSYGKRGKQLYCIQDAAAAVEHILLLAVDKGLDTCWIGAFDEEKISKILHLPSYSRPVALIPIGYSTEKKAKNLRMKTKELIHYNQW